MEQRSFVVENVPEVPLEFLACPCLPLSDFGVGEEMLNDSGGRIAASGRGIAGLTSPPKEVFKISESNMQSSMDVSFEMYSTLTATGRRCYDQPVDYAEGLARDSGGDQFSCGSAIVLCDTAHELAAGTAAGWIADSRGTTTALLDLFVDLGVDRLGDAWNAITGDRIRDVTLWNEYTRHKVRRNAVVHHGMVRDPK
jgi:hypothetical protein